MKNEKVWFEPLDKWDVIFEDERIKHSSESKEHLEKKKEVALEYIDEGYKVGIEVGVSLGYVVDVIASKSNEFTVTEVGYTTKSKLENLQQAFSCVKHLEYQDNDGDYIKDVSSERKDSKTYVYLIPILSGKPAYNIPANQICVYKEEVEDTLLYITNSVIPHFHRDSVGTNVSEYPINTDIEDIKKDLGIQHSSGSA